ncbi:FtsW/RodA/SpoVE family cell cycle protein [Francisella tularensis]|uniref:FtsW/RodA/SpoVE family cell cycle protein n=1 Tax=Francisella tularensis TaxID=263 RepID=UPI001CC2C5C2|nr:FtsW/RodA/SpoVE family cell cycle protein [Francisella tularensis]
MVILVVYLFIVLIAMSIANMAYELNRYKQAFIADGVGCWIALQVFVNIGVPTGLLSIKGFSIVVICYWGSSLFIL